MDPDNAPVTVVLEFENNIKVWKSWSKKMWEGEEWKSSEVESGAAYEPDKIPYPLLIEGQSGTEDFRDVSLTATVKYGEDEICSAVVKITVFEVLLDNGGKFSGEQYGENEKKHSDPLFKNSTDMNGKISWDDADGDGVAEGEGDYDTNCEYFKNCMELQGTVKPAGVTNEVGFLFNRWVWGKIWEKSEGGGWHLERLDTPWRDDTGENFADQDRTPSAQDHIYELDAPGPTFKHRDDCDYVADIADFRERVLLWLGGDEFYQCSNWYKWHSQIYLKPKNAGELTRDAPAKQKLGGGAWIIVPEDNP